MGGAGDFQTGMASQKDTNLMKLSTHLLKRLRDLLKKQPRTGSWGSVPVGVCAYFDNFL
jgi:hypothetical protein